MTGEFLVNKELTVTGNFFITSVSITGSFADKVAVSINFQGTGELETEPAGVGG